MYSNDLLLQIVFVLLHFLGPCYRQPFLPSLACLAECSLKFYGLTEKQRKRFLEVIENFVPLKIKYEECIFMQKLEWQKNTFKTIIKYENFVTFFHNFHIFV